MLNAKVRKSAPVVSRASLKALVSGLKRTVSTLYRFRFNRLRNVGPSVAQALRRAWCLQSARQEHCPTPMVTPNQEIGFGGPPEEFWPQPH